MSVAKSPYKNSFCIVYIIEGNVMSFFEWMLIWKMSCNAGCSVLDWVTIEMSHPNEGISCNEAQHAEVKDLIYRAL